MTNKNTAKASQMTVCMIIDVVLLSIYGFIKLLVLCKGTIKKWVTAKYTV